MRPRCILLLPFIASLLLAGCAAPTVGGDSDRFLSGSKARKWLAEHTAKSDSVAFTSHNGVTYGADSDAKIVFKKDGRAVITEFGYAILNYEGKYAVDKTGLIHISLQDDSLKWPAMRLCTDGADALLFRADGNPGIASGAGGLAEMNVLWPFRFKGQ